MLNYSRQSIDNKEIKAVIKTLKSDFLTQGPKVDEFEKRLKKYCSSKFATCVNSATSALHIACVSLGLKKNDILWTVPNTFVASANCGLYCGAQIDLVDINQKDFNIDINLLERKLEVSKKKNRLPKILVVVHLGGEPCNLKKIYELKKKYKFSVIEDASHALGSKYYGYKIGSCKYSDLAVFSFHPVKNITTGEGGAILTNNKLIDYKCKILRTHGIEKNLKKLKTKIKAVFYYEQQLLGYNYRMNDIEASIGIEQIKKLDFFTKRKILKANYYINNFDINIFSLRKLNKDCLNSYHLFILSIKKNINQKTYTKIFNEIRARGIGINLHYFPIHKQPFFKKMFRNNKFKISENYSKQSFSIPLYHDISKKQQDYIIKNITQIVKKNI
tara:strand:- start:211 stop:1374 length:1164 start_codon:yes stop_codon:yes gene_type:complete